MQFKSPKDLLALIEARPLVPKPKPKTGHDGLKTYERGTQVFLRQRGHWHTTENGGRRWIKGLASDCRKPND